MLESVKVLQRNGFDVTGGFIVGFDSDQPDIFDRQIQFIQNSGIALAMVGLLQAPVGTRLFKRMRDEDRLLDAFTGNNVSSAALNFKPRMQPQLLVDGYKRIIRTIYSGRSYFERVVTFLREYRLPETRARISLVDVGAVVKAVWKLGVVDPEKSYFWRLLGHTLRNFPQKLPQAITLAIKGFHLRAVAAGI